MFVGDANGLYSLNSFLEGLRYRQRRNISQIDNDRVKLSVQKGR